MTKATKKAMQSLLAAPSITISELTYVIEFLNAQLLKTKSPAKKLERTRFLLMLGNALAARLPKPAPAPTKYVMSLDTKRRIAIKQYNAAQRAKAIAQAVYAQGLL